MVHILTWFIKQVCRNVNCIFKTASVYCSLRRRLHACHVKLEFGTQSRLTFTFNNSVRNRFSSILKSKMLKGWVTTRILIKDV